VDMLMKRVPISSFEKSSGIGASVRALKNFTKFNSVILYINVARPGG
jgi:hypothetical protein